MDSVRNKYNNEEKRLRLVEVRTDGDEASN